MAKQVSITLVLSGSASSVVSNWFRVDGYGKVKMQAVSNVANTATSITYTNVEVDGQPLVGSALSAGGSITNVSVANTWEVGAITDICWKWARVISSSANSPRTSTIIITLQE